MTLRRALLLLALLLPGWAAALPFRLCTNESLGAEEDGHSAYVMLRLVLQQLPELQPEITRLPWQRCLSEAAAGRFDAVLSASHTPERGLGLAYPLDARGLPDAERRMFQVGYVLLRRKGAAVNWDGQRFSGSAKKAGMAIGAERGYSIVLFARDRGAVVEDGYASFGNLMDALRLGRSAGVLVNQEAAAGVLADKAWADSVELVGPPIASKPYFLPVSLRFREIHPQLVEKLWSAVAQARQQPAFRERFSLGMSGGRRRDIRP